MTTDSAPVPADHYEHGQEAWTNTPFGPRVYRLTAAEMRPGRRVPPMSAEEAWWYDYVIEEQKNKRDRYADYD